MMVTRLRKLVLFAEILIRIDPVVPPTVHANHGGELQKGDSVTENEDDPIVDGVN